MDRGWYRLREEPSPSPATNRQIETEGIAIRRVRNGKIVEYWSVTDVARVLQQIGVLPGPNH
jgi:hypothetical protein